jgi:hypothetical protein
VSTCDDLDVVLCDGDNAAARETAAVMTPLVDEDETAGTGNCDDCGSRDDCQLLLQNNRLALK